ncbi:hypothetical protein Moror_3701 [Moniliophthora roreri MCA 2997]|uniref:Uncharacterized protein n=1 Tax=Moniliophthora roreri (strain MCA 2997) TaxID=1381753 RepID=V2WPT2_MONRO|nr:hypothetical protein Moror_3701 [Moniliophthora roreri MCA 2997]
MILIEEYGEHTHHPFLHLGTETLARRLNVAALDVLISGGFDFDCIQDGRVKVPDADGGAEVWVTEASHIISSFIPKMPNKESCLDPIWQSDGLGESNQEIVKSLKNIIARSVDASSRLRIFPEH